MMTSLNNVKCTFADWNCGYQQRQCILPVDKQAHINFVRFRSCKIEICCIWNTRYCTHQWLKNTQHPLKPLHPSDPIKSQQSNVTTQHQFACQSVYKLDTRVLLNASHLRILLLSLNKIPGFSKLWNRMMLKNNNNSTSKSTPWTN